MLDSSEDQDAFLEIHEYLHQPLAYPGQKDFSPNCVHQVAYFWACTGQDFAVGFQIFLKSDHLMTLLFHYQEIF